MLTLGCQEPAPPRQQPLAAPTSDQQAPANGAPPSAVHRRPSAARRPPNVSLRRPQTRAGKKAGAKREAAEKKDVPAKKAKKEAVEDVEMGEGAQVGSGRQAAQVNVGPRPGRERRWAAARGSGRALPASPRPALQRHSKKALAFGGQGPRKPQRLSACRPRRSKRRLSAQRSPPTVTHPAPAPLHLPPSCPHHRT